MVYNWDFVEPLMRAGLDLFAENFKRSRPCDFLFTGMAKRAGAAGEVALQRLMLAKGVYDEACECHKNPWDSKMALKAAVLMLRSCELFDLFHTNVFPDLYRWPLIARAQLFSFYYRPFVDPKAVARLFHPDGRFRAEDLRYPLCLRGRTVFQFYAVTYFMVEFDEGRRDSISPPGPFQPDGYKRYWGRPNPARLVVREMVAALDPSDLSTPSSKSGNTVLMDGILLWREKLQCRYQRYCRRRRWKYLMRSVLRYWLEDLKESGQNLEEYGEAEAAAFRRREHVASRLTWPPRANGVKGSAEGGYRWKGFKYGPRPADWDLIWEWDPLVEELAGEFGACIEETPLALPGAWVEDDGDGSEEQFAKHKFFNHLGIIPVRI
ncbi:uncharacterized protein THITE_2114174 [Thermothielavioides terrestris NRRL 8126]|jgi:hypothetical protein|uniref:Uncharacterized protein n=1 Tax=Thermothielavioides terrestris (strain ATCC 38088 / NRRL 8126) TaxID=578455 RepID=G2QYB4_THETT|nr:uncharacterized protein THITE_2114174 [Thermothielavioides terrestris NRRL 8126]AEO66212.1 hypothetical protein THITE_2114174 [Thermothielavioides terrestris NRRL 8126]